MVTPAVVIMRDRVSYAKGCVAALTAAGFDVYIVDHASTWPPAVEWLYTCGLPVHHRDNAHPRSLWDWDGLAAIVGNRRYVVTDPDVVPDPHCPADWPAHLDMLLDLHPTAVKAGLGLRIDNLPAQNADAGKVREWEAQWWRAPTGLGAYDAPVDTTLALYQPLTTGPAFSLGPAVRSDYPYVAWHLPWYEITDDPTLEVAYYRDHAISGVSHWLDPDAYTQPA